MTPVQITYATPGPNEERCSLCKGKGMYNKYDEGYRSLLHSEELAALRECYVCGGKGVVPK